MFSACLELGHFLDAAACLKGVDKRHSGAAICNASVPGKSIDEFRVSCGGLDLPSIRNLIGDQGLRQQFSAGDESDVTNEINRSTHIVGDDFLLVMIFSLVTYARLQHASAETSVVNDNRQRFSIAVPDFSDRSTSDGAGWSTMAQAIASDLGASGRLR